MPHPTLKLPYQCNTSNLTCGRGMRVLNNCEDKVCVGCLQPSIYSLFTMSDRAHLHGAAGRAGPVGAPAWGAR